MEGKSWEYRFFVDFEGNLANPAVKNCDQRSAGRSEKLKNPWKLLKGAEKMRTNELMLYKSMEHGEILDNITFLMENYDNEYYNREDLKSLLFECIHELLELSVRHGFEGNLWHTYLTFLLASDENAYSTSCEIVGAVEGRYQRYCAA